MKTPRLRQRLSSMGVRAWPGGFVTVLIAVMALGAWAPVAAFAWHRQHRATTEVSWSPTSGMIEVVHELHAHDMELALISEGAPGNLTLVDVPTKALAALYVAERFALSSSGSGGDGGDGGDAAPVALTLVGAEFLGDVLVVYQEAPAPEPPPTLCVQARMLMDLWPDQTNTVLVDADRTRPGPVQVVTFDAGAVTVQCIDFKDGVRPN